jgi:uncharacterized protein
MDPEMLRIAIPGCEQLTATADAAYALRVKVGISAIRGTYDGSVRMSEAQPEHSYRLVASGAGMGGGAEGDAVITLVEDGDGTVVRYQADVKARGAIARLGSRLVAGAARMMAERFFESFETQLAERSG